MATWASIGLRVSLAAPYQLWREAPWLREVITDSDELGRVQAFRLTEAPHIKVLDSAVERWLTTDELPTFAPPANHLLGLRFSTVGHLLTTFDGFFPPPKEQHIGAIYRQFLVGWWKKHGANFAVGFSCSGFDHRL